MIFHSTKSPIYPQGHYNLPTKKTAGWWYTYPSEKYESQLG